FRGGRNGQFCRLAAQTAWFGSMPKKGALSPSSRKIAELLARGAKVETDFRTLCASILAHILAHILARILAHPFLKLFAQQRGARSVRPVVSEDGQSLVI